MRRLVIAALVVAVAALAIAGQASAATAAPQEGRSQQGSGTYTDWYYGQQDGGHVSVNWATTFGGGYWNKGGVMAVAVSNSPAWSTDDGFYDENIVDFAFIDSWANPGQWISSYKLAPGTYYVAVFLQWGEGDL